VEVCTTPECALAGKNYLSKEISQQNSLEKKIVSVLKEITFSRKCT
jgi:NADH:ubiquinone oxidoreductase subunit E